MQPVRKDLYCDLCIVGGGVGGCAAAIVAARRGLRVIIVEKGVSLGGLATNGYVPQIAGNIEGICLEFTEKLNEMGQLVNQFGSEKGYYRNPLFEPEFGKMALESMVTNAGARILYDATCIDVDVDGDKITRALFHTRGGNMGITAQLFIDSTGDADLSYMAGVPYEVGGVDFAGLNMSTTLGTRWANANFTKYKEANQKFREQQIADGVKKPLPLTYALEEEWIKAGKLVRHVCNDQNPNGFHYAIIPPTTPDNADFVTFAFHSYFCHNTDCEDITRQIIEQHNLIKGWHRFMREAVPGFENLRLVGTGNMPGIRDSRRIFGEYVLKASDVACGTKFEDGIARFPEFFDTHHPTSDYLIFMRHIHLRESCGSGVTIQRGCIAQMHPFGEPEGIEVRSHPGDYCDIPYRSLLPLKIDNLLVVGRCCSAEFHANGAMRIIGPAMGTGHAAGVAAYLTLRDKVRPRDLDGRYVRKVLIEEDKVELDKPCGGYWAELAARKGTMSVGPGDFIVISDAGRMV